MSISYSFSVFSCFGLQSSPRLFIDMKSYWPYFVHMHLYPKYSDLFRYVLLQSCYDRTAWRRYRKFTWSKWHQAGNSPQNLAFGFWGLSFHMLSHRMLRKGSTSYCFWLYVGQPVFDFRETTEKALTRSQFFREVQELKNMSSVFWETSMIELRLDKKECTIVFVVVCFKPLSIFSGLKIVSSVTSTGRMSLSSISACGTHTYLPILVHRQICKYGMFAAQFLYLFDSYFW